jgi:hypothetical protein
MDCRLQNKWWVRIWGIEVVLLVRVLPTTAFDKETARCHHTPPARKKPLHN